MEPFYKCFLGKDRTVVGIFEKIIGNTTQLIEGKNEKSYYYYEGNLSEIFSVQSCKLDLTPNGFGTLHTIYGIQRIITGNFIMGNLHGFGNIVIPSKEIDMTCNYIKGYPDKNSTYMMYMGDKFIFNI